MSIDLSAKNIDPAFGQGGYYVNEERPAIRCVCTLGGNNAIRACTFEQIEPYFYVLGITPQGAVDPTFGVSGEVRVNVPGATLVAATSMLSAVVDGAEVFYVLGEIVVPGEIQLFICRFHADGRLDSNYGVDGFAVLRYPEASPYSRKFKAQRVEAPVPGAKDLQINPIYPGASSARVIDTEGSLYAGFRSYWGDISWIMKVTGQGKLDLSFNATGMIRFNLHGSPASLGSLVYSPEQKRVIASGYDARYAFVVALDDNGSPDTSFGDSGYALFEGPAGSKLTLKHVAESNDRLVVVGDLRLNTGPQFGVVLGLDNNGRLDNSFNNGQVLVIDRTGFSADFYYVSVQTNGSIFAAGRSQFYDDDAGFYWTGTVVALQPGGAFVPGFGEEGWELLYKMVWTDGFYPSGNDIVLAGSTRGFIAGLISRVLGPVR